METFKKDEVREVSAQDAQILLRSPHIEEVIGNVKPLKGVEKSRSMKGVETE